MFLILTDGIPSSPCDEHLGWNDLPRLTLVVGRVTAHAERLGRQHHRAVPTPAPIRSELRGCVSVQHVVAVEGPPGHAVRLAKLLEPPGEMVDTHHRAQCNLVVLNHENHRQALDRRKVEGLVGRSRLHRSVANPGQRDTVDAVHAERQRQPDRHRRDVADVGNRL